MQPSTQLSALHQERPRPPPKYRLAVPLPTPTHKRENSVNKIHRSGNNLGNRSGAKSNPHAIPQGDDETLKSQRTQKFSFFVTVQPEKWNADERCLFADE